MFIYEFKFEDSSDWVYAPKIKEAKEFYLNFTGCGDLSEYTVKRVPVSEWDTTYIVDPNESEPDEWEDGYNEDEWHHGYKIIESLRQYAERNTTTDMIATTEF